MAVALMIDSGFGETAKPASNTGLSSAPNVANGRSAAPTLRAIAAVVLLIVAVAGCATEPMSKSGTPSAHAAPYIGMFTGEFVDGVPLYRFPPIEVVGTRRDSMM